LFPKALQAGKQREQQIFVQRAGWELRLQRDTSS